MDLNERQANVMDVCLLLKLFFREMPDPLFPRALYLPFMDAGRKDLLF